MKLEIGMGIIAREVHGKLVCGNIQKILVNTIIVSKGVDTFLIRKKFLNDKDSNYKLFIDTK